MASVVWRLSPEPHVCGLGVCSESGDTHAKESTDKHGYRAFLVLAKRE